MFLLFLFSEASQTSSAIIVSQMVDYIAFLLLQWFLSSDLESRFNYKIRQFNKPPYLSGPYKMKILFKWYL